MKSKSEKNVAILVKRNKKEVLPISLPLIQEERWGTKGLWSWCGWMRK
jgi:hypothetical protein